MAKKVNFVMWIWILPQLKTKQNKINCPLINVLVI